MTEEPDRMEAPPRRPTSQIDENLRRVYKDMLKTEVPSRFTQLIEQLRQQDRGA